MWTSHLIAKVLGVRYKGENFSIDHFHFDTRLLGKHDCFIALDKGHEHIKTSGAILTIGEHDADIIVEDTYKSLWKLGEYASQKSAAKKIVITGSVGKTTTKHLLCQMLSQVYKNVVVSDKSYNNHIGVPLTLTKLKEDTDIGIFEIGSNNPGEIEPLSRLVHPDIAVITNISEAHIGHYKDGLEGIKKEKFSIQKGLKKGGILIGPDVEFKDIKAPIEQEHHQQNLNMAINVLEALGISHDQIDFSKLTIPSSRGRIYKKSIQGKGITIIDDAYNAPYAGVKAALYELSKYKGRKVAVLADMGELGDSAYRLHKDVISYAKELNIDHVIPWGSIFADILQTNVIDKEKTVDWLEEGDIVLFKGSNASGIGQFIKHFL